jgi:hypothetical protein
MTEDKTNNIIAENVTNITNTLIESVSSNPIEANSITDNGISKIVKHEKWTREEVSTFIILGPKTLRTCRNLWKKLEENCRKNSNKDLSPVLTQMD